MVGASRRALVSLLCSRRRRAVHLPLLADRRLASAVFSAPRHGRRPLTGARLAATQCPLRRRAVVSPLCSVRKPSSRPRREIMTQWGAVYSSLRPYICDRRRLFSEMAERPPTQAAAVRIRGHHRTQLSCSRRRNELQNTGPHFARRGTAGAAGGDNSRITTEHTLH